MGAAILYFMLWEAFYGYKVYGHFEVKRNYDMIYYCRVIGYPPHPPLGREWEGVRGEREGEGSGKWILLEI